MVKTLAGGVDETFGDGFGSNAGFANPRGVAVDASNNVYVADYYSDRIRKVTASGGT